MSKQKKHSYQGRAKNGSSQFVKITSISVVVLLLASLLVAGISAATSPSENKAIVKSSATKDILETLIGLPEAEAKQKVLAAGFKVRSIKSDQTIENDKPEVNRITLFVSNGKVEAAGRS